ncbi:MAG: hypothetical protein ACSHW1_02340 [Yoonia sp.]|uniref:hypothetical protein n=1 Tax=Yoonia sp. TaxID=2212373 RepID=UPI003EF42211
MIKSGFGMAAVALMLAGCVGTVPVEPGIGFDSPTERALREAQLSRPRGMTIPAPQVTGIPSPLQDRTALAQVNGGAGQAQPTEPAQIPASELAAAGIGQGGAATALRPQGLDASPNNPAPQLMGTSELSDEQSFDAVSGRETIESDAERRAAQAAARQQVAPTAVPDRPRDVGPNIVEYALNAPNVLGQEWYSRSLLSGEGRFRRNCATYATADDAQRDFLARGGPERDRRGIDPDGDGFACGWDPAPFIRAFQN